MKQHSPLQLRSGQAFRIPIFVCLLTSAFLLLPLSPVQAQGQNPPIVVDPNSMWGEVVDGEGNIRYDNLTDLGEIQQRPDWMQVPMPFDMDIQLTATYHEYQTPTGNIIVLPSATTLFFMALNPDASGMNDASSALGNGVSALEMLTANYLTPERLSQMGYNDPDAYFSDVVAGQTNIWSAFGRDMKNFYLSLMKTSIPDRAYYSLLLLYTPDMGNQVPGGWPAGAIRPGGGAGDALGNGNGAAGAGNVTGSSNSCGSAVVTPGAITVSGEKTYPNYALVVGQDPDKVGVDLTWTVTVAPTIYTWWEPVPKYDDVCHEWHSGDPGPNCKTSSTQRSNNGYLSHEQVGYDCVQHSEAYPEGMNWGTAYASLNEASRDWILNGELQIRYPGAYLHNPDWVFMGGGVASYGFQGDTFVWTLSEKAVQVADPGTYTLDVAGATSGTPVSTGRPFRKTGGAFPVYLEEVVIIG